MLDGPIIDQSSFPIVVKHAARADILARGQAICDAVAKALSLPKGVALSADTNYATLSTCGGSGEGPCIESLARVNGFAFGLGSKKTIEYLSLSFVGLNAAKEVIEWSEDLQAFRGTASYWKAVNACLPPPKPPKPKPSMCALLTFVNAKDEYEAVPITAKIRALVAAVAPPAPAKIAAKKPKPSKR